MAKLGLGEREPRERVLLGEMGGGEAEGDSTQAGTLGVPAPRLCPKHEPLACVSRTMPRAPARSCPGAFGGRGRLDGAGIPGGRLGCEEAPMSPGHRGPPAASGPCSPRPAIRRAGKEENNTTEGAPRLP